MKERTFKDFIAECENYEHSKEHYEIMKEAAEIMLLEQFISDQAFVKENTETTFSEGYLMESVSEEQLKNYNESLGAKIKGAVGKILGGIGKIFRTIAKFFDRLGSALKSSILAKKAGLDNKKIEELDKFLQEEISKDQFKHIDFDKNNCRVWVLNNEKEAVLTVKISAKAPGCVSFKVVTDLAEQIKKMLDTEFKADDKKSMKRKLSDINKITNIVKRGKDHFVDFDSSKDVFDVTPYLNLANDLDDLNQKDAANITDDADTVAALNELYLAINEISTNTLKLYAAFNIIKERVDQKAKELAAAPAGEAK